MKQGEENPNWWRSPKKRRKKQEGETAEENQKEREKDMDE